MIPKRRKGLVTFSSFKSNKKALKKGRINDYRFIKKIGEGSFAKVRLFRLKNSDSLYAAK